MLEGVGAEAALALWHRHDCIDSFRISLDVTEWRLFGKGFEQLPRAVHQETEPNLSRIGLQIIWGNELKSVVALIIGEKRLSLTYVISTQRLLSSAVALQRHQRSAAPALEALDVPWSATALEPLYIETDLKWIEFYYELSWPEENIRGPIQYQTQIRNFHPHVSSKKVQRLLNHSWICFFTPIVHAK